MKIEIRQLSFFFVVLGLLLLPFSSGVGENSVVVSFALPFFIFSGICFVICCLSNKVVFRKRLMVPICIMAAFCCWIIVTAFFSNDIISSQKRALAHLIGFLMFLSILSQANYTQQFVHYTKKLLKFFVLFGFILAVYFLISFAVKSFSYGFLNVLSSRIVGGLSSLPWGASNCIAAVLLFPFYVSLSLWVVDKERKYFICANSMLFVIALTLSRNALFLGVVSLFVILIVTRKYREAFFLTLITVGCVLIVSYFLEHDMFSIVGDRVNNLSNLNGRRQIWERYVNEIDNYLIYPAGYYNAVYKIGYSAHNFVLNTIVEQGVIGIMLGLSVYLYAFLWALHNYLRCINVVYKRSYIVIILGLFFSFINLQFEDANFVEPYIFSFWFYLAIIYVLPYYFNVLVETNEKQS